MASIAGSSTSIVSLQCFKPNQAFTQASNFNAVTLSFNDKSFLRCAPLRSCDSFAALFVANNDRHNLKVFSSESKSALTYTEDASESHNNDIPGNPNSSTEEYVNGEEISEAVRNDISEPKRAAKIHDFCFGIPYGGIVFIGGLVGFVFSRNPATLISGGLYGGSLLALSILSLKIWRQGHSNTLFILGQAGLAAALLWKNMQTYSLTKKILPTGFFAVISASMLCFYTYVMVSGGNPPSKKKLKSYKVASSSFSA